MFWNKNIEYCFENIFECPSVDHKGSTIVSTLEKEIEESIQQLNYQNIIDCEDTLTVFEKNIYPQMEGYQNDIPFNIVLEIKKTKNDYNQESQSKYNLSIAKKNGELSSVDEKITLSSKNTNTSEFIKNFNHPCSLEKIITDLHYLYDSQDFYLCSDCYSIIEKSRLSYTDKCIVCFEEDKD